MISDKYILANIGAKIQHITQDYTKEKPCAHSDGDHQYSSKVTKWSPLGGMQCEHTMAPQIENVNEDTDIVLATMGGNDIDFDTVVEGKRTCEQKAAARTDVIELFFFICANVNYVLIPH